MTYCLKLDEKTQYRLLNDTQTPHITLDCYSNTILADWNCHALGWSSRLYYLGLCLFCVLIWVSSLLFLVLSCVISCFTLCDYPHMCLTCVNLHLCIKVHDLPQSLSFSQVPCMLVLLVVAYICIFFPLAPYGFLFYY